MYFTFGKYSGFHVSDVPSSYLAYALEQFALRDPSFEVAIRDEMAKRFGQQPKIVNTQQEVYRKMAKKYHPDAGGSDAAMQAVNEFYQLLKKSY